MSWNSCKKTAVLCVGVILSTTAATRPVSGQTQPVPADNPVSIPADVAAVSDSGGTEAYSEQQSGPRFKAYPDDAEPIERWLYAMLDQRVTLNYPGPDVPLKDVLADIEDQISEAHGATDDGENRKRGQ